MKFPMILILLSLFGCGKHENDQSRRVNLPDPPRGEIRQKCQHLALPDSLGGINARGWIGVDAVITRMGTCITHDIVKIVAGTQLVEPKTIYSIYDSMTSLSAVASRQRYEEWVTEYLKGCVFQIDTISQRSRTDTIGILMSIRMNPDN